jgi:hypothetical protein
MLIGGYGPSTAWQSHDFYHLIARHGLDQGFWDDMFGTDASTAVVFGQSMVWIEDRIHWAVRGYHWSNGLNLVGRKDRSKFYVDIAEWIQSEREAPAAYLMPDEPKFLRGNDAIYRIGGRSRLHVLGVDAIPFRNQKTALWWWPLWQWNWRRACALISLRYSNPRISGFVKRTLKRKTFFSSE